MVYNAISLLLHYNDDCLYNNNENTMMCNIERQNHFGYLVCLNTGDICLFIAIACYLV